MYNHSFGMGFGGGFMWLFWILLIVIVIWFSKDFFISNRKLTDHSKTALEILKERYVKGEIEQDEFAQKKKDLES